MKSKSSGKTFTFLPCAESTTLKQAGWRRLVAALWAAVFVAAFQSSTAQPAAGFPKPADLPLQASLPDPLVMLDGRKVATRERWMKERRPELIQLFQHYMYGQLPPQPKAVSGKVERVDVSSFDGKATLSEVMIRFGPPEVPPIQLSLGSFQ